MRCWNADGTSTRLDTPMCDAMARATPPETAILSAPVRRGPPLAKWRPWPRHHCLAAPSASASKNRVSWMKTMSKRRPWAADHSSTERAPPQ
eukprot:3998092-Pyramimonas_sp.AAC.1